MCLEHSQEYSRNSQVFLNQEHAKECPRASLIFNHLETSQEFSRLPSTFQVFPYLQPSKGHPVRFKKPRSALEKFLSLESFYDILHMLFRSFSTQEILSLGLFPDFPTAFQTFLR